MHHPPPPCPAASLGAVHQGVALPPGGQHDHSGAPLYSAISPVATAAAAAVVVFVVVVVVVIVVVVVVVVVVA